MTTTDQAPRAGGDRPAGKRTATRGSADGMTLAAWLDARSDDDLLTLLELRPDLAVPLPASMTVLAARAEQRASVLRACDDLDTLEFAIIETLAVQGAAPVPRKRLHALLADRVPAKTVDAALARLIPRALVWGQKELQLAAAAKDALPWQLGSITEVPDALTEPEILALLAEPPAASGPEAAAEHHHAGPAAGPYRPGPAELALLDKLAATGPRGRTRDAAPGTPPERPIQQLLAHRLLNWVDEETVELPPAVGQVLRREPVTDPHALVPPRPEPVKYTAADVNAAAAGEVGELLRHCGDMLEVLGQVPAPALRSGGLGVRELRRVAKQTGIDETRVGLLAEVLAAARLLDKGIPEPPPPDDSLEDCWAPTTAADGWRDDPPARRWVVLARAWLELDRFPWMIGLRDANDKPLAALSVELRTMHAVRDRRAILTLLAEFPAGCAVTPEDLARILAWRRPRWRRYFRAEAIERTLAEAAVLGVVGRGALTSAGRALLHGPAASGPEAAAERHHAGPAGGPHKHGAEAAEGAAPDAGLRNAEAEMVTALPAPVDHVLVQGDLTVIAPGPLVPDLQDRIALVADIESAGAATVYRIGEASVRRALDGGMTAAELHQLFAAHSRTPVPQSLSYLIDDVARRHGRLRAGMAQSFVRSEDPALLAEVLVAPVAERLALRAVAPTVAISQAPLGEVLEQLRAAGFSPAGEDSSGTIVDLRPRGARIPARPNGRNAWRPNPPSAEQLRILVAELRAGEKAARARSGQAVRADGSRTSTAATMALLQLAVRVHRPVHIGYVDAQGVATQRIVEPLQVSGGQLDALDPDTGAVRHFTLHRIASVALVEQ